MDSRIKISKKDLINYAFGFLLLISLAIWNQVCYNQRNKEEFKIFNKANINGKIESIREYHKFPTFKIEGDTVEYTFLQRRTYKEEPNFSYVAEKGDSIIKAPYSDTLKLLQGNKTYEFKFYKFE